MNYIEIEVGGELRGFRFGLGVIGDLMNHFQMDFIGLGEMMQANNMFSLAPALLYFGHYHAVRKEGKKVEFTIYDCEEWVENASKGILNDDIQSVAVVFLQSMSAHIEKMSKEADDGPKKK